MYLFSHIWWCASLFLVKQGTHYKPILGLIPEQWCSLFILVVCLVLMFRCAGLSIPPPKTWHHVSSVWSQVSICPYSHSNLTTGISENEEKIRHFILWLHFFNTIMQCFWQQAPVTSSIGKAWFMLRQIFVKEFCFDLILEQKPANCTVQHLLLLSQFFPFLQCTFCLPLVSMCRL